MKKNFRIALFLSLFVMLTGLPLALWAGPQPVFSSNTLDFGEAFLATSKTLTLQVTNTGDAAYIITNVTANPGVFTESTLFGIVEPGDTFTIDVTFTPIAVGVYNGNLNIQSTSGASTIALIGQGVEPTLLDYSPDTLFVTVPSGSRDTVPLTLINGGNSTLQFQLSYVAENGTGLTTFYESFESTPWDFYTTPEYVADAVNDPGAPQGVKVLSLSGGIPNETTGMFFDVPNGIAPYNYVGYWFKPTTYNLISGVFRLYTPWSMLINSWYNGALQQFNVYTVSNNQLTFQMNINQWHHIEYVDIDYLTRTYDLYIDGQKVVDNQTWYFEALGITRVQISNWDSALTYYDAFTARNDDEIVNLLDFIPQSGSVGMQQSFDVGVAFNAEGLAPGEYTGKTLVENNSQNNPQLEVPFVLTVTDGSRLIVSSPDTLDFGQIFVGIEAEKNIKAYNLGSDPLLVAQITPSSSIVTTDPPYGIISGFDSLGIAIKINATTPGSILEHIEIQSTAGNKIIYLRAEAQYPPLISVQPDSICITLVKGQDSTVAVVVQNTGQGPLYYDIPLDGEPLNRVLNVAAIAVNGSYLGPVNIMRDSSLRITEFNNLPATLDQLAGYDLVIMLRDEFTDVWYYSNFAPIITQFVQQGGGVLFTGRPYGDILSATGLFPGYHYFNSFSNFDGAQVLNEPEHPAMQGLQAPLEASNYWFSVFNESNSPMKPILTDIATQLTLVGYRQFGNGRVAYLGFDYSSSNPDSRRLLLNMGRWASGRQLPEWLTAGSALNGILANNESDTLVFNITTDSLEAGQYQYFIRIASNDPVNNQLTVPVKVIVIDIPATAFSPSDDYLCDGTVSFVNNTQNGASEYYWDFGDGNTSTEASPTHTYTADGVYTVQLIACNFIGCDTLVRQDLLTVNLNAVFCDTLSLLPNNVLNVNECTGVLYDSGGPLGNYIDGESSAAVISAEPGDRLRLRIYDIGMEPCCDRLSIYDGDPNLGAPLLGIVTGYPGVPVTIQTTGNKAYLQFYSDFSVTGVGFRLLWECGQDFQPEASFSNTTQFCQNFIQFQNESIGASEYYWDFGDGASSTLVSPLHIFENTGDYEVTLYAIADGDTSIFSASLNIPFVTFYAAADYPATGVVDQDITFSINSPFPLSQVFWEINGASANSTFPVVASFQQPGQYFIRATIYDNQGCVIVHEGIITINLPDGLESIPATKRISMNLAPNPTSSNLQVRIESLEAGPVLWRLFDGLGRVVQQGAWEGSGHLSERIDLSALPDAVYRLVVQQGDKTGVGVVIKG